MAGNREFETTIRWTGNRGAGTSTYRGYDRKWEISDPGKPGIICSNDPALGGDPGLHNPEDLLIASLAGCHMLWYLHLCSSAKVTVVDYGDRPVGFGEVEPNGAGRFTEAVLRPRVTISPESDAEIARKLHWDVHQYCFIARSVSFPIRYEPVIAHAED